MKIQVLCGMIASGKSTYANNAARSGIICINDDAIVNMLHANNYNLYDEKLKILYKSIENNIISNVLSFGKTILIDRGLNVGLNSRKRWLSLANSFDVRCEAIVFKNEGAEAHAKRRFETNSRGLELNNWIAVAKRDDSIYVKPTIEEGFDLVEEIDFEEIINGKIIY